ncbi:hypothetical protein [Paenibacillus dakarensis]|uniref:hypothetical protein n=1 Tax=Paenibacillus dakarensis TaxID=1527293 RepID=UPI0006D52E1A|nr:hypothetical protein [Paenibacillus dakarensis]
MGEALNEAGREEEEAEYSGGDTQYLLQDAARLPIQVMDATPDRITEKRGNLRQSRGRQRELEGCLRLLLGMKKLFQMILISLFFIPQFEDTP